MRPLLLAAVVGSLVSSAAFGQAGGSPVQAGPIPGGKGETVIQGKTTFPGTPQTAFAAATEVERWARDLPDVKDVKILEHTRDRAVVSYVSSILGPRAKVTLNLHPDQSSFDIRFEGMGYGDVTGTMEIVPAGDGQSTATLTTTSRRAGGLSNVIPSGTVRDRMTRKVRSDLMALYKRMTTEPPAIGGSGQQQAPQR
jgi:hypothetical protein